MKPRKVTLYSRPACPPCDLAASLLEALGASLEGGLAVEHVDISTDPELLAGYGAQVPVLRSGERLLPHATTRLRIERFLAGTEEGVRRG